MSKLPSHISYLLGLIGVAICAGIAAAILLLGGCASRPAWDDFEEYQIQYIRDAGWSEYMPDHYQKVVGKVCVTARKERNIWMVHGSVYGYGDTLIDTGNPFANTMVAHAENYIARKRPYEWSADERAAIMRRYGCTAHAHEPEGSPK